MTAPNDFFSREDDYSRSQLDEIFAPLSANNCVGYYSFKRKVVPRMDAAGVKQGKEVLMNKNNIVQSQYVDGNVHGLQISAHKNGDLYVSSFDRGTKQGPQLQKVGAQIDVAFFERGVPQGRAISYQRDTFVKRFVYRYGTKHGPLQVETDGFMLRSQHVHGDKRGPYVIDYADGRTEHGSFFLGTKHGNYYVIKDNNFVEVGNYDMGHRSGFVTSFSNGQLVKVQLFELGVLIQDVPLSNDERAPSILVASQTPTPRATTV